MNIFTRFVIVIYVLRMFMPFFEIIPSLIVLFMALFILFHIISQDRTNWVKSTLPQLFAIYLILFFTDIAVRPLPELGNALYANFILWVLPFIYLHIFHNNDTRLAKTLLYTVIFAIAVTAFTTYLGCLRFPGISRQMATGRLDIAISPLLNIGGFDTIYVFVLMLPILCFRLRFCKIALIEKMTIIATITLVLVAIFQSEYTTALLFSIVSIVTLFIPPSLKWKKMIRLGILTGIFAVVFLNLISVLLIYISDNIESTSVSGRLTGLALMLQGQEGYSADETDAQGRLELIDNALEAFVSSPIWGVQKMVGGHSYVAGIIAYYGLLGLIMLIIYFKKLRKLFTKYYEQSHCSTAVISTEIIYFCFLILNPRIYLIVPFLFLPLFSFYNNKTIKSK